MEQVRVGVKNWGVEKPEFLDSIHFLKLAGYIETRTIEGRISGADLATTIMTNWKQGRRKGIRLMQGSLTDECVKV